MHRNSVYKELDLDKFEVSTALRKERTRDYDKEPLVINGYEKFLRSLGIWDYYFPS